MIKYFPKIAPFRNSSGDIDRRTAGGVSLQSIINRQLPDGLKSLQRGRSESPRRPASCSFPIPRIIRWLDLTAKSRVLRLCLCSR
ncbi:hypothetical protein DM860_013268 [Cuscuta australis]|uniref:Uncharacterized protein n=1 Tax=Cuscuta australis TaxID=267555 RepID=A0A328DTD3_9ASTE|nr:hypothetical protein DM860_013268 [Cuscuta australis]